MLTLFLYYLITLCLAVGVAWMVGHTIKILFGADETESIPTRRIDGPLAD